MRIINVNVEEKTARIFNHVGDPPLHLGTPEGTDYLLNSGLDAYAVELEGACDVTLFIMRRRKDGTWLAYWENEPTMGRFLGESRDISYDKIIEAWDSMIDERNERTGAKRMPR